MSYLSGWEISEWAIAIAATLTAFGVVWQKVVVPVRAWWRGFKAWMLRIEQATSWCEVQMSPDGGSSLSDKINAMQAHVALLLEHDRVRDVDGKRYNSDKDDPKP